MDRGAKEKICLVTGATSGIGLATARGLAENGFTTVVVGRDGKKCETVCRRLKRQTGAAVTGLVADLSSQAAVRRLAQEFESRFDRLDVLVNNAGAKFLSRGVTVDGLEMTFALNHLGYFLLTRCLMGPLKAAGNARIINVSSGAHWGAAIDFADLQNERHFVGKIAYNRSKLANLLFTYELARRMNGSAITVNAVNPGGVITNFCRNNGWISWGKHVTAHILARNLIGPQKAARTILYLATSPEVEGITGKYYFDEKPVSSSKASCDPETARRLWEISQALTA